MNIKQTRIVLLICLLAAAVFAGVVSAGPTDTVTIDINVTQEVSIDVTPNSTAWYGVSVGSTTDAHVFTITNIGSVNISTIDASITNSASNPYGTGQASNFNAGDFILLNSTNNATFYYINKKDWNESKPSYVTAPTDWTEGNASGYFGRMRSVANDMDMGQEYFWFTNRTAASGDCHGSAVLLIANHPRTVTDSGDTDFTNSENYTTVTLTSGVGEIPSGHDLAGYCVSVSADCSEVTFFHFNMQLDAGGVCSSDQYVYGSSTLQSGASTEIWLEAKVPLGVSDGDVSQGTLTFTAAA